MGVEVDGFFFHPFHGGMLAGGVIPSSMVYECGFVGTEDMIESNSTISVGEGKMRLPRFSVTGKAVDRKTDFNVDS